MTTKNVYWHVLSPLHIGTGRGTGLVDLPIQREKHTKFPMIPGSAIKGVLRDAFETSGKTVDEVKQVFGSTSDDSGKAGAVCFSDAMILLLPVRAFKNVFAWITCPTVLQRYSRDLKDAGVNDVPAAVAKVNEGQVLVPRSNTTWPDNKVILEDLDLSKNTVQGQIDLAEQWSTFLKTQIFEEEWQADFKARFIIVSDEVFSFLAEMGTEVRARIRLDDNKHVEKRALWYEEYLPAETVLVSLVWQDLHFGNADLLGTVIPNGKTIQFGGKGSIGAGRVRVVMGGGQ
jgi:CRISPR-associated protein Cmr4